MANRLEMLSNIQFSSLRLASNHIPAQAVDDTHASHTGTFEVVNFLSNTYNIAHPANTIVKVIAHSVRVNQLIFTGGSSRFLIQYIHP